MNNFVQTLVIALVTSGTVGSIVSAVMKKIFTEDPSKVAMKLLIQDRLTSLCRSAIEDKSGKISYSNWSMINSLYSSYKELGGNGDMEHLMKQIERIPVFIDNPNK